MSTYRCPKCGFPIFNRRVRKCESCRSDLPAELLFSPAEISALDAQYEMSKQERDARIEKEKRRKSRDGGSYGGEGSWGGGADGGDGGGGGGGGD